MDVLIEDLGLTTVRASNVSSLTHSEKQRLSVACQLLAQSSILILDQVTSNMDIFDTFFLVEYLRQWCSGGRIVIMTLQPPTFEILSMCSGVLLLSGGRTVFSGSRSDLPRHMGELGYPCPPFKNPADYYCEFKRAYGTPSPSKLFLISLSFSLSLPSSGFGDTGRSVRCRITGIISPYRVVGKFLGPNKFRTPLGGPTRLTTKFCTKGRFLWTNEGSD